MPEKDPLLYEPLRYLLILAVAMAGGVVDWIMKVRKGEAKAHELVSLIGHMFVAAFAGLITFWLAQSMDLNHLHTAPLVGMAGYMGPRAMTMIERIVARKFGLTDDGAGR